MRIGFQFIICLGLGLFLAVPDAAAYTPEDLSPECETRCRRFKKAKDGFRKGFRYKHSEIPGAGMVALTYQFSKKAVFLEANTCQTIQKTRYFGVANGNRHHYYSSRDRAGARTPKVMVRKAKRKAGTNLGYFAVGNLCYGPFNLGREQD